MTDSVTASKYDKSFQDSLTIKKSVLICVDYLDTDSYEGYSKRKKDLKGKIKLSLKNVIKHLFSGVDSIKIENIYSGEMFDNELKEDYISKYEFYILDTLLNSEVFTGLIYEQIDNENSYKYFTTINKKGKFIARVLIACYVHSGSYTAGDGSRLPWYDGFDACITKDSIIEIGGSQGGDEKRYKIQPDGKIIKIIKNPLLNPISREAYEKLLITDSNNAQKHLEYACLLNNSYNDFTAAKKEFEKTLQINPKFADANYLYAQHILWKHNDTTNAIKYFKKAIEYAPNVSQYYSFYAYFLMEYMKDTLNAKKQYEKAVEVNPNNEQAHLSYANFLFDIKLSKEARQHYIKATKLNPSLKNEDDDLKYKVK